MELESRWHGAAIDVYDAVLEEGWVSDVVIALVL